MVPVLLDGHRIYGVAVVAFRASSLAQNLQKVASPMTPYHYLTYITYALTLLGLVAAFALFWGCL